MLSSLQIKTFRWPELPKGLIVTIMPPQLSEMRGGEGDLGEELEKDDEHRDPD